MFYLMFMTDLSFVIGISSMVVYHVNIEIVSPCESCKACVTPEGPFSCVCQQVVL